jgi:hypothetical protein
MRIWLVGLAVTAVVIVAGLQAPIGNGSLSEVDKSQRTHAEHR